MSQWNVSMSIQPLTAFAPGAPLTLKLATLAAPPPEIVRVEVPVEVRVPGPSAYDLAVQRGFVGTLDEWLAAQRVEVPAPQDTFHSLLANEGYSGVAGQGFRIPAEDVTLPEPLPKSGIFLRLTKNLADEFENFGLSTAAPGAATFNNRRLELEGYHLTLNADYDAAGLLGNDGHGTRYWEVGSKALLEQAPTQGRHLFLAGSAEQHVALVAQGSTLTARFKNGSDESTLTLPYTPGQAFGWRLYHRPDGTRRFLGLEVVADDVQAAEVEGLLPRTDVDEMPYTGFAYFPPTGGVTFGKAPETVAQDADKFYLCEVYARNVPMISTEHARACIDPRPYTVTYRPVGNQTYKRLDANTTLGRADANGLALTVADVPVGAYTLTVTKGDLVVTQRPFQVLAFMAASAPLDIDFTKASAETVREHLMAAHKGWGGANGGVLADNVELTPEGCKLHCQGDAYTGPLLGVNGKGQPNGINKRMGACVVTKRYFGPGRYRFWIRSTANTGVCNAIWTFHYEEAYPGESKFADIERDGMRRQGGAEPRIIRNHEIDIEWPTALKSNPDQEDVSMLHARFNTWEGELTSGDYGTPGEWAEYHDNILAHGIDLGDGQVHELGFDWHIGRDPRVEFFIDGQQVAVNRNNVPTIPGRLWVGAWFPSGSTRWAGKHSNWESDHMLLTRMSVEPFVGELAYQRLIGESFPNDVFREIA